MLMRRRWVSCLLIVVLFAPAGLAAQERALTLPASSTAQRVLDGNGQSETVAGAALSERAIERWRNQIAADRRITSWNSSQMLAANASFAAEQSTGSSHKNVVVPIAIVGGLAAILTYVLASYPRVCAKPECYAR